MSLTPHALKTYVIIAYDGSDEGAAGRRLQARPAHLTQIEAGQKAGVVKCAVALQNEAGTNAIGSLVILELADAEGVQAFLEAEPYVQEGVWQSITVHPGAVPPMFKW
jgi:uncharacterized protein YciI